MQIQEDSANSPRGWLCSPSAHCFGLPPTLIQVVDSRSKGSSYTTLGNHRSSEPDKSTAPQVVAPGLRQPRHSLDGRLTYVGTPDQSAARLNDSKDSPLLASSSGLCLTPARRRRWRAATQCCVDPVANWDAASRLVPGRP